MDHNVLGSELVPCSYDPLTGYFRDGCCNTDDSDLGAHVICTKVTAEFLAFSAARGNDLGTPQPAWRFNGLKPGDRWCLCANRWKEAFEAGCAPLVVLESTHIKALEFVLLEDLERHAVPSRNSSPLTAIIRGSGTVDERFKSHAWKACEG